MSKKQQHSQQPRSENQKLIESLIDLYLSVKIRSNEEIDNYTEEMLTKERNKLRDVDAFTILDYIKTSIEILMNMKMEEQDQDGSTTNKSKKTKIKDQQNQSSNQISDSESARSIDEPPKDYEAMLQKYEAEVRNHIKIEQQLKLHIECVQDKLDDSEKAREKQKAERQQFEDEVIKDLNRYKDLLGLREKEIDNLKIEYKRIVKSNEDLKKQVDKLDKECHEIARNSGQNILSNNSNSLINKETPVRSVTAVGNKTIHEKSTNSQAILEEISYNQNFENTSTDQRGKNKNYSYNNINNGQVTTSSGMSQSQYKTTTAGNDVNTHNISTSSDRGQDLLRLKKEYHNMARQEINKLKKEGEQSFESQQQQQINFQSKSPDRMMPNQTQYNSTSNNNSFMSKSPYISNNHNKMNVSANNINNPGANDYHPSSNKRGVIIEKQVLKDNSNSKNSKLFQPVGISTNQANNMAMNHKRAKSQLNQPGSFPNQQQLFQKQQNGNQAIMNQMTADEHRKFISENSIDNNHPHNQSYVHYNQIPTFTETGNQFNSHTMDARINTSQITQIPTSILSGTYINSNIIVHQKHIDSSARNQSKKTANTNIKRTSSIHEEKKMVPNESSKQIISASGGHMRTGSYDMNVAVHAMMNSNNHSFAGSTNLSHSQHNGAGGNNLITNSTGGVHSKKKSLGNASNKNLLTHNYLSAGNTQMGNFSLQGTTNIISSAAQTQHTGIGGIDHHSFDNGLLKSQQRPQSQMSNYQRKLAQKNSMLAAANQKKKDTGNLTSYQSTKKGDTYRGSPARFQ